uniref:Uncharacterized protein n=1 Tax=Rhizophora mucronata TaxID=61149 RepID=A0A2P2PHE4_RHIMU
MTVISCYLCEFLMEHRSVKIREEVNASITHKS